MIFVYLWRAGLLGRADREKLRFFAGLGPDPLALSRRSPLIASVDWVRAFFSPRYAQAVTSWLAYRADLYDGRRG